MTTTTTKGSGRFLVVTHPGDQPLLPPAGASEVDFTKSGSYRNGRWSSWTILRFETAAMARQWAASCGHETQRVKTLREADSIVDDESLAHFIGL